MKLNRKKLMRRNSVVAGKSIISNINENKSVNIRHNKRSIMQFKENILDFLDYESKSIKKINHNEITPKKKKEIVKEPSQ